jgi:hypothetical protein
MPAGLYVSFLQAKRKCNYFKNERTIVERELADLGIKGLVLGPSFGEIGVPGAIQDNGLLGFLRGEWMTKVQ